MMIHVKDAICKLLKISKFYLFSIVKIRHIAYRAIGFLCCFSSLVFDRNDKFHNMTFRLPSSECRSILIDQGTIIVYILVFFFALERINCCTESNGSKYYNIV